MLLAANIAPVLVKRRAVNRSTKLKNSLYISCEVIHVDLVFNGVWGLLDILTFTSKSMTSQITGST
jgi:hypothetical protein